MPLLPTGFIPPDDLSQTQVTLSLPPGSTFAQTFAAAEQARALVQKNPHVKLVYTAIGGGSAGGDPFAPQGAAEVRTATLTINMTPRQRARRPEQAGHRGAAARGAGSSCPARASRSASAARRRSTCWCWPARTAACWPSTRALVERELRTIPGIGNVTSTSSLVRPELIVRPDFAGRRPGRHLGGHRRHAAHRHRRRLRPGLAKLNLSQRQVPVVVKLQADARTDLELLSRLAVPGARGPVMLGNVATLAIDSGPAQIDRYDRAAQHQLRDRAEPAAAGRGGGRRRWRCPA